MKNTLLNTIIGENQSTAITYRIILHTVSTIRDNSMRQIN